MRWTSGLGHVVSKDPQWLTCFARFVFLKNDCVVVCTGTQGSDLTLTWTETSMWTVEQTRIEGEYVAVHADTPRCAFLSRWEIPLAKLATPSAAQCPLKREAPVWSDCESEILHQDERRAMAAEDLQIHACYQCHRSFAHRYEQSTHDNYRVHCVYCGRRHTLKPCRACENMIGRWSW